MKLLNLNSTLNTGGQRHKYRIMETIENIQVMPVQNYGKLAEQILGQIL